MLPAAHRMRASDDFTRATRQGSRAGSRSVVVHTEVVDPTRVEALNPTKVGFVVGKNVGGSVVRHRVARRLRAQVALRLDRWPNGRLVVVRALPAAAAATSRQLGADLDSALSRAARVAR
ncbi:MAG: ribonuclease P protein component [Actinomycetes bacterium]